MSYPKIFILSGHPATVRDTFFIDIDLTVDGHRRFMVILQRFLLKKKMRMSCYKAHFQYYQIGSNEKIVKKYAEKILNTLTVEGVYKPIGQ